MAGSVDISGRSVAYALVNVVIADPPAVEDDAVTVIFENDDFQPAIGEAHCVFQWRPGEKTSAMDGGSIREEGVMRVDVCAPIRKGMTFVNALCDEVESKYPPACRLAERGGWVVTLMSLKRAPSERLAAWLRVILDIRYIAVRTA